MRNQCSAHISVAIIFIILEIWAAPQHGDIIYRYMVKKNENIAYRYNTHFKSS